MSAETAEAADFGVSRIDKAMWALWERARNSFSADELEWFAGLDHDVPANLRRAAETLETAYCNSKDEAISKDDALEIVLSVSINMYALAAIVDVSGSAVDRLRHPEIYGLKGKDSLAET
ncbi:hypothetical protein [Methylomonas sp. HYX-M1]|uniref:hypothetical protein n=1 Tax=Methylomonas sp. HYX-M1 TaxID=3139307 RepID=UPI00345B7E42